MLYSIHIQQGRKINQIFKITYLTQRTIMHKSKQILQNGFKVLATGGGDGGGSLDSASRTPI
jgi:hypothetical protein